MHDLAPCPACARHIKLQSVRCPFCDVPVYDLAPLGFDPAVAPARVRYAALALGASLALTGCPSAALYGGPPVPPPAVDAGAPLLTVTPAYGIPPSEMPDPVPQVPPDAGTPRTPPPSPDAGAPRPPPAPVPAYGLPPDWRPPPSPPSPPPRPTRPPRPAPPRDDPGAVAPMYGVPSRE